MKKLITALVIIFASALVSLADTPQFLYTTNYVTQVIEVWQWVADPIPTFEEYAAQTIEEAGENARNKKTNEMDAEIRNLTRQGYSEDSPEVTAIRTRYATIIASAVSSAKTRARQQALIDYNALLQNVSGHYELLSSLPLPSLPTTNNGNSSPNAQANDKANRDNITSMVIPNEATSIEDWAFYDVETLTSLIIPKSVQSIGDGAFWGCSTLSSLTIPNSVKSIGGWAFYGCCNLKSLTIPNSVTSIGWNAFSGCDGLTKLFLPLRFKGETDNMGIPSGCKVSYMLSPGSTYKVAFNANGGKLPKGKSMAKQTMTYGQAAKLRKNVFTRSGYVFMGWAKSKKGAVIYKNAQAVRNVTDKDGTVTLYAKWAKKTYKVAFYANGGKGKMAAQTMTYGNARKLSANKFKRNGYQFQGWATSKANAGNGIVKYKNRKSVKNLVANGKTVKLYAVWKKK